MRTAIFVFALLAAACGEDYTITDQPLTGTVGGQSWTYVAGDTSAFLSDDDFFASLYATDFDECGFGGPAGNSLILNIPMSTGEYELSLSRNMTFVVEGQEIENLIGTEGLLRVDAITTDTITGGIYARFDGDNEVDGNFEITICSDATAR